MLRRPPGHRAGTIHGTATGAGEPTTGQRTELDVGLLAVDFQGIYQVHIAAATERLTMMRFALSLLAAPFVATAALVSARVVSPHSLTSWRHIPFLLFALLAAFGVLAVLPYLRMIEASITHARTARALNNFRLLYSLQLKEEFATLQWTPNLPVDPGYPELFAPLSWPGVTAVVLAAVVGCYISVGLAGLARAHPAPVFAGAAVIVIGALAGVVYFLFIDVKRRRKPPVNPFDFPSVET